MSSNGFVIILLIYLYCQFTASQCAVVSLFQNAAYRSPHEKCQYSYVQLINPALYAAMSIYNRFNFCMSVISSIYVRALGLSPQRRPKSPISTKSFYMNHLNGYQQQRQQNELVHYFLPVKPALQLLAQPLQWSSADFFSLFHSWYI